MKSGLQLIETPLRPRKQELPKGFAFRGRFFNHTSVGACGGERQILKTCPFLGSLGTQGWADFRKLGTVWAEKGLFFKLCRLKESGGMPYPEAVQNEVFSESISSLPI